MRIVGVEANFAADPRNSKAIAVVRDPEDNAIEDAAIFGRVSWGGVFSWRDFTKAERIEHGDGPRTHGENVAQNSADACRRALKRFHKTRMVVRFDLEGGDEPVANVHNAGIFVRPLYDKLSARWQALQVDFARFVGAVLAPHHAENAQLGDVRLAPENLFYARVFFGGKAVLRSNLRRDFEVGASRAHIPI